MKMVNKTIVISQKDLKGISSGVQKKVHEEIRYFSQMGNKVYVVAEKIDKKAVISSGGIPAKTFRWPKSGYYRRLNYLKRATSLIKKLAPDLVIGHGDIVDQDICYIHNCVHLAHECINKKPIPENHEVALIHAKILTEQKFQKLVCNSNMMKRDLVKRFSIPPEKVEVIYPEFNPEVFNLDGSKLREKFRTQYKLSEQDVVLGLITSGNFKKRNLDLLIEAAQKLNVQGVKFKVVVAGKDKIDNYLEKIKLYNLLDHFIFVPGIKEVEQYYHGIDIFVLPAHIEEFGRSVLEAMSCGKPVVVSNMVGAAEILTDLSMEFVVKLFTAEELSQKLKMLINDSGLRTQLGTLNNSVAQSYSRQAKDQELSNLLNSIT